MGERIYGGLEDKKLYQFVGNSTSSGQTIRINGWEAIERVSKWDTFRIGTGIPTYLVRIDVTKS